jgi:hypothetical protein
MISIFRECTSENILRMNEIHEQYCLPMIRDFFSNFLVGTEQSRLFDSDMTGWDTCSFPKSHARLSFFYPLVRHVSRKLWRKSPGMMCLQKVVSQIPGRDVRNHTTHGSGNFTNCSCCVELAH